MAQLLSNAVQGYMANSSMIRKMFEQGILLKKQYGEDKVYDFSLGNPDLPAPKAVVDGLKAFAEGADRPFSFGYTPNAGAPWAREALAKWLSKDQGVELAAGDVLFSGPSSIPARSSSPSPPTSSSTTSTWPTTEASSPAS